MTNVSIGMEKAVTSGALQTRGRLSSTRVDGVQVGQQDDALLFMGVGAACLPWKGLPARTSRQVGLAAGTSVTGAMGASQYELFTKVAIVRRDVELECYSRRNACIRSTLEAVSRNAGSPE